MTTKNEKVIDSITVDLKFFSYMIEVVFEITNKIKIATMTKNF